MSKVKVTQKPTNVLQKKSRVGKAADQRKGKKRLGPPDSVSHSTFSQLHRLVSQLMAMEESGGEARGRRVGIEEGAFSTLGAKETTRKENLKLGYFDFPI